MLRIHSLLARLAPLKTTMHSDATSAGLFLEANRPSFYTALERPMKSFSQVSAFFFVPLAMCLSFAFASSNSLPQEAQQKPAVSPVAKEADTAGRAEKPAHPAEIDLRETKV